MASNFPAHGTGISPGEADVYTKFEGQRGVAESSLNPSGFVSFERERMPGRSKTGEFIEAGAPVKVVGTNPFGLFVRVPPERADLRDLR